MTFLLGIETATPLLSVAVVGPEGLRAERAASGERLHSVRLFPFLQELFSDAGICPRDLRGIAVSQGPGSFTGLRLGVITAKTIAQVLELPVVGVPTLLVLAAQLPNIGAPVCPVLTSRRGEVYAAVYAPGAFEPPPIVAPFAAAPEEVARKLAGFSQILLAGEGAWASQQIFTEVLGEKALFAPKLFNYPRAAVVAALGYYRMERGEGVSAFALLPEYLRSPAITGVSPA
uniref:tRNA (Adenosine(37)-N6)-threonylcarbamoyltransferase complex dimerization subunit type 1 TsaB n=1 Tax=Ammonifex degensii TaxID=42838 RepID=A0A7C1F839_9THEO